MKIKVQRVLEMRVKCIWYIYFTVWNDEVCGIIRIFLQYYSVNNLAVTERVLTISPEEMYQWECMYLIII
jgi:hypothetical protein